MGRGTDVSDSASSAPRAHAVLYGAKSTEDVMGSIQTQLEDARHMAVVGEFSDEAFSVYHGNRGPDLVPAKALAVETAAREGRCILLA